MPAMDDWQRKAEDLAKENRKRRERGDGWKLAGTIIAAAMSFAVWWWAVFGFG